MLYLEHTTEEIVLKHKDACLLSSAPDHHKKSLHTVTAKPKAYLLNEIKY